MNYEHTTDDELEALDQAKQEARFRPVQKTDKQRGHVIVVMSCAGREALLGKTIRSLRRYDKVILDGRREGQAKTFFRALRYADSVPNMSAMTLLEDDTVHARNFVEYAATTKIDDDIAMVSWFYQLIPQSYAVSAVAEALGAAPVTLKPQWMIERAEHHSCNQAITMSAATVKALLASEQLSNWTEPHAADMLIGQVMPDALVAYHTPNLVQHTGGDQSKVGNTGERKSPTFVGEKFDALRLR